jgi:hypothetical protein
MSFPEILHQYQSTVQAYGFPNNKNSTQVHLYIPLEGQQKHSKHLYLPLTFNQFLLQNAKCWKTSTILKSFKQVRSAMFVHYEHK